MSKAVEGLKIFMSIFGMIADVYTTVLMNEYKTICLL